MDKQESNTIQDLVSDKECPERVYYDRFYKNKPFPRISISKCGRYWNKLISLNRAIILKNLPDLLGKKVLLLGNGISEAEFFLLTKGAHVVYSDLSVEAVRLAQQAVEQSEFNVYRDKIEFFALDATKALPFPENSFDVIYGAMFVHHFDDEKKDLFLSEIYRCLKEGGVCRFSDCAYSPLWQNMKTGLFNSLRVWFYKTRGNSPEDIKASQCGGFKEAQIIYWKNKYGFRDYLFERHSFFLWLGGRLGTWLFFRKGNIICECVNYLMYCMDLLCVEHNPLMRNHMINLVWGYTK